MSLDKRRWIILAMQIIIGIAGFFIYLLAQFVGPLNELKGWSVASILLIFTAMTWVSPFAMMIGGKLRDKFGNRRVIVFLGIVYGGSICVSVLFKEVWGFVLFGGFITAFAMFGIFVCQLSNVGLLFPDKRGFAIGLFNGITGFGLAAITMPVVFLIEHVGITAAIIILGVVMGGVTVVLGFFAIDPPYGYKPEGWNPDETELDDKRINLKTTGLEYNWKQMIMTSPYYILVIALIGIQIGGSAISSNVSLMAQEALDVGAVGGGLYSTLSSVAAGVGAIFIGGIIDKLDIQKGFLFLGGLNIISTLLYIFVGQGVPFFFGLVVVCCTMGQSGQAVLMATAAMNYYGEKNSGFNIGVLGLSSLIAGLIGPMVTVGTVNTCFTIIGCVSFVSVIAAASLGRAIASTVRKARERESVE